MRSLRKSTIEELKEECQQLEEDSGMMPFLEEVIQSALKKAAFRSVNVVASNIEGSAKAIHERVNNKV